MKKDQGFDPKINIKGSFSTDDGDVTFDVKTLPGARIAMSVEGPIVLMKNLVTHATELTVTKFSQQTKK